MKVSNLYLQSEAMGSLQLLPPQHRGATDVHYMHPECGFLEETDQDQGGGMFGRKPNIQEAADSRSLAKQRNMYVFFGWLFRRQVESPSMCMSVSEEHILPLALLHTAR